MPKRTLITVLIALLLLTAACASAPQATETLPSDLPAASPDAPPPSDATLPPAGSTEIPVEPSGLKVVYSLNGNLWLWSEATPARQLTTEGGAGPTILSDDGKVIVYQREQALWAINYDGSNARQLVDVPAFSSHPYLTQYEFQPGTHILYFSTRDSLQSTIGLDLHRVDADAPAPQTVLQQGGQFTFSPDGRFVALAQAASILVAHTDGTGLVSALTFAQVNTYSDWYYYPQVVWLNNSTGFYTVIPASDPAANPSQKSRFLYVSADGSFNAQLAEFNMADVRVGKPLIAPNGSKLVYATRNDSTVDLHIIDASTADKLIASHSNAPLIGFWAWSPDSERFTYFAEDAARLMVAGINLPSTPIADALSPYSLTWVDANRFLYFREGQLLLGQVGNPVLSVIATDFPSFQQAANFYDFAP